MLARRRVDARIHGRVKHRLGRRADYGESICGCQPRPARRVLYWYQTARRAVAGEWASKFWLVADAVRDRRTDTALVRIVVEDAPANNWGSDQRATRTAADFARAVYPVLREQLPR